MGLERHVGCRRDRGRERGRGDASAKRGMVEECVGLVNFPVICPTVALSLF